MHVGRRGYGRKPITRNLFTQLVAVHAADDDAAAAAD